MFSDKSLVFSILHCSFYHLPECLSVIANNKTILVHLPKLLAITPVFLVRTKIPPLTKHYNMVTDLTVLNSCLFKWNVILAIIIEIKLIVLVLNT